MRLTDLILLILLVFVIFGMYDPYEAEKILSYLEKDLFHLVNYLRTMLHI